MKGSTMIDALGAVAPPLHENGDAMLFAPFIGEWDVVVTYHRDGITERRRGEWLFEWVLDGMAVQDVWRVPSRAESASSGAGIHGYGTTVRFYDPACAGPYKNVSRLQVGGVVPGRSHPIPVLEFQATVSVRKRGGDKVMSFSESAFE